MATAAYRPEPIVHLNGILMVRQNGASARRVRMGKLRGIEPQRGAGAYFGT